MVTKLYAELKSLLPVTCRFFSIILLLYMECCKLMFLLLFIVTRALIVARAPSPADVSGHPLVKVLLKFNLHFFCVQSELTLPMLCSLDHSSLLTSASFPRNPSTLHMRLSANVRCLLYFLKQNNKNVERLRYYLKFCSVDSASCPWFHIRWQSFLQPM